MTLSPALVRAAGIALFGTHWRTPLARLLNVNERFMRRIDVAFNEGIDLYIEPAWLPEIKAALEGLPEWRREQAVAADHVLSQLADIATADVALDDTERQRMAR